MNTLPLPQQYGEIITVNVDVQNDFMLGGALPVSDGDCAMAAMIEAGALALSAQEIINGSILVERGQL